MLINFAKKFIKQRDKAPVKIQEALNQRLLLFIKDPYQVQLNNHKLTGKYSGYRSINITGDWRAIFSVVETTSERVIVFEVLGTHSQLYK